MGCFCPVTTRNRPITVDFDHRQPLSGSTDQFQPSPTNFEWYQPREKKKREKKRENLEIRHCSPDLDPHPRTSRPFVGKIFGDRGEKKTMFLLHARASWRAGFSLRPWEEISSPFMGRRNVSPRRENERG
ncbi:hypothetical protein B296_00047432 [Ensete ventricosum]|uniref:Uncharacterized protein n=1 Tax=Ensete ventricosum TaxID=4639 RepID=A0A426XG10_ENSVE|nr:hypothetical protein B296_00047432 [Ensete ventricosum]